MPTSPLTPEQAERLAWLDHVLSDPDCGRMYSLARMGQLAAERDELRRLAGAPGEEGP